jgi:hypothetical protein
MRYHPQKLREYFREPFMNFEAKIIIEPQIHTLNSNSEPK